MSFNSKRTIVILAASVVLFAGYAVFALGGHAPEAGDLKAWAIAMLIFIGISIATMILIMVVFHVAFAIRLAMREHAQGGAPEQNVEREMSAIMKEDEMDQLISLKARRVGHWFTSFGFIAALAALALGVPAVAALHVILGAVALTGLSEGVASIVYYERGVRNGG